MTHKLKGTSRVLFGLLLTLGLAGCNKQQARAGSTQSPAEVADFEREKREFEKEKLTYLHRRELSELKEKHQQELERLKSGHAQEVNSLKETHQGEVRQLAEQHRREVEELTNRHRLQVEKLEGRITVWATAAIAAGVVVAASWIGFFVFLRRRNKREADAADWDSHMPNAEAWKA